LVHLHDKLVEDSNKGMFSSVASFTAGSDAGASDRITPRRHRGRRVSHVGHSSHV
jgi:hypothetical protein